MAKKENNKWFEAFSNGEVWELKKSGIFLFGRRTYDDPSYFDEDEIVNNEILDFEEKARIMGLKAIVVVD